MDDSMRDIPEGELRRRLKNLPGVKTAEVDPDDPDGDFLVHMDDGSRFFVKEDVLKAAWQENDEILIDQLQQRSQRKDS